MEKIIANEVWQILLPLPMAIPWTPRDVDELPMFNPGMYKRVTYKKTVRVTSTENIQAVIRPIVLELHVLVHKDGTGMADFNVTKGEGEHDYEINMACFGHPSGKKEEDC